MRTRVIWVYHSCNAATALLPTHQPQVRQPLRPLGQGSELLMYLVSLNDGLLNVSAHTITLIKQLYLSNYVMTPKQEHSS
jgi:hypothetical protein